MSPRDGRAATYDGAMLFRRCYLDTLAQASYVIGDGGEAVIVDPRRDIDEYLALCQHHGLRLRWVLATHVHADFVAGLAELRAATGAEIGMGAAFDGELPCQRLDDGHELTIGDTRIRVMATPGHTPESVSFLLQPGPGHADKLLSGDAMFLGDVGRPDLVAARGCSPRDMAKTLWHSLHDRIARLPDSTEVWPAHGAGSACGTAIGCEESSTIGLQRLGNWALSVHDPELFATRLIENQRPAPRYFAMAAAMNRRGPRLRAELPTLRQLDREAVVQAVADGAVLLDGRSAAQHAAGHWPGAIGIGLRDSFESWCGALLPLDRDLVLHASTAEQASALQLRLARVGIERLAGWTASLPETASRLREIDAVELFVELDAARPWQVIDIRRPVEWHAGHVALAVHAELGPELAAAPALTALDRGRPTAVICETGYRSTAAAALLRAAGFTELANVRDGMVGWRNNSLPIARTVVTSSS